MLEVDSPPPDPDPNAPNECSLRTIPDLAYLGNDPECISWWTFAKGPIGYAGRPLLSENDLATAQRILRVAGISESDVGGPIQCLVTAGRTLLACCDALESLINASGVDEPTLLRFFKEQPHAAFLIEPDHQKAWREQKIQGYGQIDVVFQKTNGRYVAVEIEPPNEPIFCSNDEFSKRFDHAIDQVEQWKLGALKHPTLLETSLGMSDMQPPDGAVVMGRSANISTPKRQERWHNRSANTPYALFTWDDILVRGRSWGNRLGNPVLPTETWA